MSTDVSSNLPRKKRSILWYIAGIFAILLGVFFYQLYGPSPPIIVSRATTHITAPLNSNGLPDYAMRVLELGRDGITPENNAAVLFWYAMGLKEVEPKHRAMLIAVLELDTSQLTHDALQWTADDKQTRKRVSAWVAARRGNYQSLADANSVAENAIDDNDDIAIDLLTDLTSRPWTSEQVPPLAEWIEDNDRSLDLLVEAARRSLYYSPSPTLLESNLEQGSLFAMLQPALKQARSAQRSLMTRAMWHLGAGRIEEAWQDLHAVHRFSMLLQQDPTLAAQLLAISLSNSALWATATLLHDGDLSPDQARQVQRDLNAFPRFSSIGDSIDGHERLAILDMICGLSLNPSNLSILIKAKSGEDSNLAVLPQLAINWNQTLMHTNHWFDRCAAALRLPTYSARRQAFDSLESHFSNVEDRLDGTSLWGPALLSRAVRGRIVADHLVGFSVQPLVYAGQFQDRANTLMDLTRLVAALAVHRTENGSYPNALLEVTPRVIKELPRDLYNAQLFHYERIGEGYLLYSFGPNGIDDGGSNIEEEIFQGIDLLFEERAAAEERRRSIPAGADDISIRQPRPPLQLPFPASRGVPAPDEKRDVDQ